MPTTNSEQGAITEAEFVKFVIGTNGRIPRRASDDFIKHACSKQAGAIEGNTVEAHVV